MASPLRSRIFVLLCLAGAALLGISGKLWLIHHNGVDVPYMDQWHAEGQRMLIPDARGELTVGELMRPHNEHRLFWTRGLALGLVYANGQWDARVGMVLNVFIHAAGIVLVLSLLTRASGPACLWFGALAAVACLAIPFAWENTLASFQSQFYLWLLFTVSATWLMLSGSALGGRWWAGFTIGVLAFGTMASGFFAFAATGAILAAGVVLEGKRGVRTFVAIAICGVKCAIGWALVNHVPHHDSLRARGVLEFVHALANQLAFPATDHPWLAPVMQAPVFIWLLNRGRLGAAEERRSAINGLIVLAVLAIASIAWSRGGVIQGRDSRYTDIHALLFLINAVLLVMIVLRGPMRPSVRGAVAIAWCVAALVGFTAQINLAQSIYLPHLRSARAAESERIASFLRDGDPAVILEAPKGQITFPDRNQLVQFLSDPAISSLMPASVRTPVRIEPDETRLSRFTEAAPQTLPHSGRAWHSDTSGGASFVSKPLPPSKTGVLRFRIAGDLGTPAFPFHLRSLSTGATSASEVDVAAGQRWKTVNIVRPPGPIVIEAGPSNAPGWGAFTEPVELGMLSWIAGKTAKQWMVFAAGGTACMLAAVAIAMLRSRRRDIFSLKEDGTVVLSSPDS
ncbi:MAG TPA: hypothetical protein VMM36_03865 [Opitutaceae bacterium]|nr:hypothetical protein [Opitutaceae bacterium]